MMSRSSAEARLVKAVHPRPPASLFQWDAEAGVLHAKRPEDAAIEHVAERSVLDARDEQAEEVGRVAVVKCGAWLVDYLIVT